MSATSPPQAALERFSAVYDATKESKAAYVGCLHANRAPETAVEEDRALAAWAALANRSDEPNDWRRLGICRFIFGRPGVVSAFSSAAALVARQPAPGSGPAAAALEGRYWRALFVGGALPAGGADKCRAWIVSLHLGWFDHFPRLRLARLERDVATASAEAHAAETSADMVDWIDMAYGALGLFGAAGLLTLAWRFVRRRLPRLAPRPVEFTARARLSGFLTYLLMPFVLGALLLPFRRPLLSQSGANAAFHYAALYIPVSFALVAAAISIVRWQTRRDRGSAPGICATLAAIGWRVRRPVEDLGAGLTAYAMIVPLTLVAALVSGLLFRRIWTPPNPVMAQIGPYSTILDRLALLLETVLIAPIVEETMFRGLLYPALKLRWGRIGGVLTSAAIFGAVHPDLPGGFLPIFTLGVGLAVVYEWRGSLLPGIAMHGLQNAFSILTLLAVASR